MPLVFASGVGCVTVLELDREEVRMAWLSDARGAFFSGVLAGLDIRLAER